MSREIKLRARNENNKSLELIEDLYWFQERLIGSFENDYGYKFEQYVGLPDKNGKDMYENDLVRYTKTLYTDCSREEIEEVLEPIIGRLYFAEGIWLGIQFEDGTGNIFMAGTISREEFEVFDE